MILSISSLSVPPEKLKETKDVCMYLQTTFEIVWPFMNRGINIQISLISSTKLNGTRRKSRIHIFQRDRCNLWGSRGARSTGNQNIAIRESHRKNRIVGVINMFTDQIHATRWTGNKVGWMAVEFLESTDNPINAFPVNDETLNQSRLSK